MVIAGECEVPVVAGEQQGNAVVGQQRVHVSFASPARREDVEVLLEPPSHLGFIHGVAPYRRDATADSATAAGGAGWQRYAAATPMTCRRSRGAPPRPGLAEYHVHVRTWRSSGGDRGTEPNDV